MATRHTFVQGRNLTDSTGNAISMHRMNEAFGKRRREARSSNSVRNQNAPLCKCPPPFNAAHDSPLPSYLSSTTTREGQQQPTAYEKNITEKKQTRQAKELGNITATCWGLWGFERGQKDAEQEQREQFTRVHWYKKDT